MAVLSGKMEEIGKIGKKNGLGYFDKKIFSYGFII